MSIQIAETRFITKSSSGLAAVDVYGKSPDKTPINSGGTVGIGGGFNTPVTAGKINELVKGLTDALNKTKGQPIDKVLAAVKQVAGNKKALIEGFKNTLVTDALTNIGFGKNAKEIAGVLIGDRDPTNLLAAFGKTNPEMGIVVNGIQTIVNAKDLDSAKGIGVLLGQLTGNSALVKVLDLQPETLLLKSLLDDATKLRVPALIDAILDSTKDNQDKIKLLVLSSPRAAQNSDLETLKKTMDEIGDTNTLNTHPTLVSDILRNYRTLSGDAPTEADSVELQDVLNRLKPEWWLTTRNGETDYDLDPFYRVSRHAVEALKGVEALKIPLAMVGLYPVQEIVDLKLSVRPWAIV